MTRTPIKRPAECLANSKRARRRRSSQIRKPPEWNEEGPRSSLPRTIPCSTSSEASCSLFPDNEDHQQRESLYSEQHSWKCTRIHGKEQLRTNISKALARKGPDIVASNRLATESTTVTALYQNTASSSSTANRFGEGQNPICNTAQLQTPPTSSQTRPVVVISTRRTSVPEARSYRRIILPSSSPLPGSEPSDHADVEETQPLQSYITLRSPEEINKLAQDYHKLTSREQRKYLKTKEVRRALWPEETRPSDSLLQFALHSMRPQERHEKYPFAFNSQGTLYAEYDHLRVNDQNGRSDPIDIVPSVENKRKERVRPSSELKLEQPCGRLPARYSPDLWVQDQSSFDQEVRLRAENEEYRRENEILKAEIEKLKERGQLMTQRLMALQKARSQSLEHSAALASGCEMIKAQQTTTNAGFIPRSALKAGSGTTFVVRIHNIPSPPATQTMEPMQA